MPLPITTDASRSFAASVPSPGSSFLEPTVMVLDFRIPLSLSAVAVITMSSLLPSSAFTISSAFPLNALRLSVFLYGSWSRGSPLSTDTISPPSTSKVIRLSASGTMIPVLSSIVASTNTISSPSFLMYVLSAESSTCAASPDVFTTSVAITFPFPSG